MRGGGQFALALDLKSKSGLVIGVCFWVEQQVAFYLKLFVEPSSVVHEGWLVASAGNDVVLGALEKGLEGDRRKLLI